MKMSVQTENRPTWAGGGSLNPIAERTVSRSLLCRHPHKNGHEDIDIVDDENLCFTSMQPMKPTDILGDYAGLDIYPGAGCFCVTA